MTTISPELQRKIAECTLTMHRAQKEYLKNNVASDDLAEVVVQSNILLVASAMIVTVQEFGPIAFGVAVAQMVEQIASTNQVAASALRSAIRKELDAQFTKESRAS